MSIGCLTKIISGAQTGADRGGMDAALELGLPIGGWAPQGWRSEDGCIPLVYRQYMRQSISPEYKLRTRLNVQDSDGTLLLSFADKLTGGSKFTGDQLKQQRKPAKHLVLPRGHGVVSGEVTSALWDWIETHKIAVLNIAGPRESKEPGLQLAVQRVVGDLLRAKRDAVTVATLGIEDAKDDYFAAMREALPEDLPDRVSFRDEAPALFGMILRKRPMPDPPGADELLTTLVNMDKVEALRGRVFKAAFADNGAGIKEAAKTGVLVMPCSDCGAKGECGCAAKYIAAYAGRFAPAMEVIKAEGFAIFGEAETAKDAYSAAVERELTGALEVIKREDEIRASGKYREAGGPMQGLSISPAGRVSIETGWIPIPSAEEERRAEVELEQRRRADTVPDPTPEASPLPQWMAEADAAIKAGSFDRDTIAALRGKTLRAVTQRGNDSITFEAETGERWKMSHQQNCCEQVQIEDVVGDLQDLVGSPIVMAEAGTNSDRPRGTEPDKSFTWTFYKLATVKGYVTIRWYGSSNGYYGETADFRLVGGS